MAIWKDPLLPKIEIPADLKTQWFQIGSAKYQLLPSQYEFLAAKEEILDYVGGYGSAKTFSGILKATHLSMFPNNRGLVGRFAATDLEETTQRDMLDFLKEAELLKEEPNARTKTAIVYCVDPLTGKNLGYTSEIAFQHVDNPKHLKGRKLGWAWIDEASEAHKDAGKVLMGRLRLPAFAGRYQLLKTGNPEGHNYIYDECFNEELIKQLVCGHPQCTLTPEECNRNMRLKRRGIHAPTYQNYFLPPDYITNMLASYSPTERQRYMDGSFDAFEGAVFPEFDRTLHILGEEV